jgi:ABC-type multidrug transport system fused ATPase/permease subunit
MLFSLLRDIRGFMGLLSPQTRWRTLSLAILMVIGSLGQTVSISLVLPFTSLALDPSAIEKNAKLVGLMRSLGVSTEQGMLTVLGAGVIAVILATNLIAFLVMRSSSRIVWGVNQALSESLLATYLKQPYVFHTSRNSSGFMHNMLAEMQGLAAGFLLPSLELVTRFSLVLFITGLLFYVNPLITISVGLTLGGFYATVFWLAQQRLHKNGSMRYDIQATRFSSATEAFGSIRETRLLHREHAFIGRYHRATSEFSRINIEDVILGQSPRLLAEALAFCLLVCFVIYCINTGKGVASIIPTLTLFTLAAYRLIPAAQQLYASLTAIRSLQPALAKLTKDLTLPDHQVRFDSPQSRTERLPFREEIRLVDVEFAYPTSTRPVLRGLNLTIPKGKLVAFCGPTGSGKSTLVDILMGFHTLRGGELRVDGRAISAGEISAWQSNFGYVPQAIFLLDADIYRNVAFGLDDHDIDRARVEEVCRQAQIDEFVREQLPQGYQTKVGERGTRLSGGQRQRIGLARALYENPEILVLDEATSALDNETERFVMEAIYRVARGRTVILIAHRLSTVRFCDQIHYLENGELIASGSYSQLLADCEPFAAMARSDSLAASG